MQEILNEYNTVAMDTVTEWFLVGKEADFPQDAGACIKYKNKQIAVFNFTRIGKWYACQNLCPHKMEMVIARGMIGDADGIPKVACPMHKKTFSLDDGNCLNGGTYKLAVYPVKVKEGNVYIGFLD